MYEDDTCWILLELAQFRVIPKQHLTALALLENIYSIDVIRTYNWFSEIICNLFHVKQVSLETNEMSGHVQLCGIPEFGDDATRFVFESREVAKRTILEKLLQERVK